MRKAMLAGLCLCVAVVLGGCPETEPTLVGLWEGTQADLDGWVGDVSLRFTKAEWNLSSEDGSCGGTYVVDSKQDPKWVDLEMTWSDEGDGAEALGAPVLYEGIFQIYADQLMLGFEEFPTPRPVNFMEAFHLVVASLSE